MSEHSKLMGRKELMIIGVTVSFGAVAFITGYQKGWEEHQDMQRTLSTQQVAGELPPAKKEAKINAPVPSPAAQPVVPLQKRAPVALPKGHPSLPDTDRHGHPSFDCRSLKAPVPKAEGELTIAELLKRGESTTGEVEIPAIVIGAYFGILGTNWYHLCDEPAGQVLVVSSDQLTPPKSLIKAEGSLLFDYNLSDVYRFPIYIKEARLSGARVKDGRAKLPKGVIKL